MKKFISLVLVLSISGCAFYQKDYVSKIYLEGKSYSGGDEGKFYIHNDPLVRISFGCYKNTQISATVFPLIPIPSFHETAPHESIAEQYFSMELRYKESKKITPDKLEAMVNLQDGKHVLVLDESEKILSIIPTYRYKYISGIRCGDVKNAMLYIKINESNNRRYKIEFKEGIERDVKYHSKFVT